MSEHKHTPGPWKEWENTKPTADDKQRIQQKASELYDEFREWAEWEACQNGAEYEHMYQRQQVNKKVAELEAERSELTKEIANLKAWKESEIKLWRPIIEYMHLNGNLFGMKLGESISDKVLEVLKLNSLKK